MIEIFKDIVGFDGDYQISNLGNVKSLKKPNHIILKTGLNKPGYKYVVLTKHGVQTNHMIHRLVALHFLPQSDKNVVNHIDENKLNNRVDNLEWCTQKENLHHGTGLQRMGLAHGKPVTNGIQIFKSAAEAERITGVKRSNINRVLHGYHNSKTAGGYSWSYVEGGII